MPDTARAESLHRATGALALAVGASATASPRHMLRLFGIAPREVTGAAAFGWRLFGVRTAFVAAGALRGDRSARAVVLPVQLADQVVFAQAYRARSVPRRAAVLAMATSGALIALDVAARRAAP
jgi:hypothetical protein